MSLRIDSTFGDSYHHSNKTPNWEKNQPNFPQKLGNQPGTCPHYGNTTLNLSPSSGNNYSRWGYFSCGQLIRWRYGQAHATRSPKLDESNNQDFVNEGRGQRAEGRGPNSTLFKRYKPFLLTDAWFGYAASFFQTRNLLPRAFLLLPFESIPPDRQTALFSQIECKSGGSAS